MTGSNKVQFYPSFDENVLAGATMIIPAVSVGNIGQLSIDILLATLKAKRFTSCHHPSLVPLVGSDPLDTKSTELMTACDMYKPEDYSENKIILVQLRSAIARNRNDEFLDDLLLWCTNVGILKGKLYFRYTCLRSAYSLSCDFTQFMLSFIIVLQ